MVPRIAISVNTVGEMLVLSNRGQVCSFGLILQSGYDIVLGAPGEGD